MEIFWNTIAAYNTATWPVQIVLTVTGFVLTWLLRYRPSTAVRRAVTTFMAIVCFWIALVYYLVFGPPDGHNEVPALIWTLMGGLWIYDLVTHDDSLDRTGPIDSFALIVLWLALAYPLCSLALGRSFPFLVTPVMPCSVTIFTVGLLLGFARRINLVLAMFLLHWAFAGLWEIYFFSIPENYLLVFSVVTALCIFFRRYLRKRAENTTKPSSRVLNLLLTVLCAIILLFFAVTLHHQFLAAA